MIDHSPTSVEDWMRCSMFWWWRHERRWVPRAIGKPDLAAWFGRAIDLGVKTIYAEQADSAVRAFDELHASVDEARAWGRDEPPDLSEIRTRIRQTLTAYRPEPWEIISIDQRLGRAVLDLVIREGEGLAVVDIKTVMKKPREEYWVRRLQEWRKSWQLADYRERIRKVSTLDASFTGPLTAYVHVIVAEPFEVVTHPITPDPGWERDRQNIMWAMEGSTVGANPRWRNRSRCHDWFGGDCPMLKACWDYESMEERFSVDYIQRPGQIPTRVLDSPCGEAGGPPSQPGDGPSHPGDQTHEQCKETTKETQ